MPAGAQCSNPDCDNGLVFYGTDEHGGAEPCRECDGEGFLQAGADPTDFWFETCDGCDGTGKAVA